MEVIEAIKKRRSVRGYLDRPIENKKLNLILESARLAPSASNRQEWRFIVVKDKSTRERLMRAAKDQSFVGEAPVVIACCADEPSNHVMTCGQLCYPIDIAIAIEHMVLKATEEGLGTCWIGAFYEDKVKEILNIPDNIWVVQMLILGYAKKGSSRKRDRVPLKKIVMYELWKNNK